jgi:multiple sugar transport system ATP-binding protein
MTLGTRIVVMKDGFVQQVGSPQELYNSPCNEFVAGFIGTPQMNFIKVKVEKEGDAVAMCFDKYRIKLNEKKSKAIVDKGYLDKEVIMGIRPEDVHDEQVFIASSPDSVVEILVDLVELLGAETYLYLMLGDTNITARVDPRSTATQGATIKVAFDTNNIHVFDKDDGNTITN